MQLLCQLAYAQFHEACQLDLIRMFPQKDHLDLILFQMHKVEMV